MSKQISLCMIVRNEQVNLLRCLNSVKDYVNQIVVVDTGSNDNTCEIARKAGAVVQHYLWNGNFSDARNASLEIASGDWILFLDADECLAPGCGPVLQQLVEDEATEGYFIKIVNFIGSENGQEVCPDLVFRLFKNRPEYRFRGTVHEQIVDVILENNATAKYKVATELIILHYGYLDTAIAGKDKIARNLMLLERELTEKPDNKLMRYHYGVELFRAGDYATAAQQLTIAANGLDPQTVYMPKLLRYIVLAYHAAASYELALEIIEIALKVFPDYADLYFYGGIVCLELEEYGRAFDFFESALAMPEQPVYYAPFNGTRGFRTYYYLGGLAEKFCQEEKALAYYIQSLQDNGEFIPALEKIVAILKPRQDPAYTKMALEKICDFCTPAAKLMIARVLFNQSAFSLALHYFQKVEDHLLSEEAILWKAICLMQERRFLEALRIMEGFENSHKYYPLATLNKLLCFWLDGNGPKVKRLANELLSLGLAPDTATVIGLLRDAIIGRQGNQAAILGSEGSILLLDIILRIVNLGEYERAQSILQLLNKECLKEHALAIAQLYYDYGRLDEAQEYLQLYLTANVTAKAYYLLAEIEVLRHELLHAVDYYSKAMELEPKEPKNYVRLIQVYEQLRQDVLAAAWQKCPNPPDYVSSLRRTGE